MEIENKNIVWEAQEFLAYKKSTFWYISFIILAICLIAYAVYIENILTIITFSLIAVTTFLFSHQNPKLVRHELTPTGIIVGSANYPYRMIKKFWIIYSSENKTLNFETTAYLNNQISIQLGKQDPVAVKMFLKSYLQEDLEKEESLTDKISRTVKF